MKYILILSFYGLHGNAINQHEYGTRESCINAGQSWVSLYDEQARYLCVPSR